MGRSKRRLGSCCLATVASTGKRGHIAPVAAGGLTSQQADEADKVLRDDLLGYPTSPSRTSRVRKHRYFSLHRVLFSHTVMS